MLLNRQGSQATYYAQTSGTYALTLCHGLPMTEDFCTECAVVLGNFLGHCCVSVVRN